MLMEQGLQQQVQEGSGCFPKSTVFKVDVRMEVLCPVIGAIAGQAAEIPFGAMFWFLQVVHDGAVAQVQEPVGGNGNLVWRTSSIKVRTAPIFNVCLEAIVSDEKGSTVPASQPLRIHAVSSGIEDIASLPVRREQVIMQGISCREYSVTLHASQGCQRPTHICACSSAIHDKDGCLDQNGTGVLCDKWGTTKPAMAVKDEAVLELIGVGEHLFHARPVMLF